MYWLRRDKCTASAVSTYHVTCHYELVHIVTFALHLSPCSSNAWRGHTSNQKVTGLVSSIPPRQGPQNMVSLFIVFIRKRDKGGRRNKGGVKLEQYGSNVTLCLNNRTNENTTAKVLCQQAGFPAAFGIVKRSSYNCSIMVNCRGNEESLEDCAIIPFQSRAYMKKAAVKCERRK